MSSSGFSRLRHLDALARPSHDCPFARPGGIVRRCWLSTYCALTSCSVLHGRRRRAARMDLHPHMLSGFTAPARTRCRAGQTGGHALEAGRSFT